MMIGTLAKYTNGTRLFEERVFLETSGLDAMPENESFSQALPAYEMKVPNIEILLGCVDRALGRSIHSLSIKLDAVCSGQHRRSSSMSNIPFTFCNSLQNVECLL